MKTDFTEAELQAAYEICFLVRDHCNNVLASSEYEKSKSDIEFSRKADKFVKAYEKRNAVKLAKSGKAGYLGDALLILGDISKKLKDIKA